MSGGGVHFPITGDNKDFLRALNQCKNEIKNTAQVANQSGMDIEAIFGRMKNAALGFTGAWGAKELITSIINVRGEFQKLEVAFTTMLGSADKADKLMAQLTRTAATTPFGLQEISQGAKQLLAYGVSAEEVNDTLIRLGDISAGLTIPLNDLVYLYGTTMTQGRLFTQDLRQFMGRGIPLAEELAKQFGVTKDKVGELVTEGKVGFEQVKIAIESMTGEGGKFGGLMEAQSKTISGQISNIEDSIDMMFNEIGQSSEGFINTALEGVSWLVENYEKVGEAILFVATTYGAYKAAIAANVAMHRLEIKLLAQAALEKKLAAAQGIALSNAEAIAAAKTKLLSLSMKGLVASLKSVAKATLLNPFFIIGTGVASLVTSLLFAKNSTERYKEAQEAYNRELEKTIEKENEHKELLNELFRAAEDEMMSTDARIDKLRELERIYPSVFEKYETEIQMLNDIKNIKDEIEGIEFSKSITNPKVEYAELNKYFQSFKKQWEENFGNEMYFQYNPPGVKTFEDFEKLVYSGYYDKINPQMAVKFKRRQELKGEVATAEFDDFFDSIMQRSKNIKELEMVIETLKSFYSGEDVSEESNYIAGEISSLLKRLTEEQKKDLNFAGYIGIAERKLNAVKKSTSSSDFVKRYKQEYDAAVKAYNDFITNNENKIDELAFQQQAEALKEEMETKKKLYQKYQIEDNKQQSERDKKAKEAEKIIGEKLADLIVDNNQEQTDLMDEGTQKKIQKINDDYNKRIQVIDKLEAEFKEQNKEAGLSVGGNGLTLEQTNALNDARLLAEEKHNKDIAKTRSEALDKEKADWNNYLIEYGKYEERKQAIIEKYNDSIEKAQTEGEKAMLGANMSKELEELDNKFGKLTSSMADLFEDSSEKSVNSIQKLIDKYETLVSYMSSPGSVSQDELFALGFTERDLEKIEKGEISIKDITDAIKNLKRDVGEKSPFKKFANDIKNAFEKISSGKDAGQGVIEIGNAVNSILPEIEKFATDIETIFGVEDSSISEIVGVVGGIGEAAMGFGRIMSGDVLGGITSAASGVAAMIQNIEAINEKSFQREQQRLEALANTYRELADKKSEDININNKDFEKAAENAIKLYEKERASETSSFFGYLQSGFFKQKKTKIYDNLDSKAREQLKSLTRFDSEYAIFALSGVDLDKLKENTELWSQLDDETKEYLENIHASNEAIEETKDKLNEAYTGITFDDFYSSFVSTLADMDSSAEDFANNFENYLFNAIMSSIVATEFQERIDNLYKDWAEMSKDGLTKDEVNELRRIEKELVDDAYRRREEIKETYQFGQDEGVQQEVSSKGFQSMSQETGEELNGRFTALQMSNEEIRTSMQIAVANMGQLLVASTDGNNTLLAIRELLMTSNTFLDSIDNTAKVMLKTFGERLKSIDDNTNNLR